MNIEAISGLVKVVAVVGAGSVLAGAIALGATNGGGGGSSVPALQVAETPISVPEATATTTAEGTTYTQDREPVAPVLAEQGGRPDCPEDWLVWRDPNSRYSVCYPATVPGDIEAITYPSAIRASDDVLWLHTPEQTDRDVTPVAFSMTFAFQGGPAILTGTQCMGLVPGQKGVGVERSFQYQGAPASSCEVEGEDWIQGKMRGLGVQVIQMNLSSEGPYLVVVARYHTGDGKSESRNTVEAILETLAIN
jgi:hypothetical protein